MFLVGMEYEVWFALPRIVVGKDFNEYLCWYCGALVKVGGTIVCYVVKFLLLWWLS